ncbi:MAG: hypothetical protein A2029_17000 [Chloroflexi bacterium RBG_19FT_COMBO_47_9]|nr:MAG: hypothetical protein A2029_17000 [Chloroflexi bacterium RBG_19FT_COMBO_47_9]
MKTSTHRKIFTLLSVVLVLSVYLSGCSSKELSTQEDLAMASLDGMPVEVKAAPVTVQQAYQFAVANPEIMKQIPCYCGCGAMGHASNYACYVSDVDENGVVRYDTHALGCSICVDITQDSMRLVRQDKTAAEIKLYIDQTYSQFGPSNIP